MKLYSPELEKVLIERVEEEISRSRELRRQYKRVATKRSTRSSFVGYFIGALFVLGAMLAISESVGFKGQLVFVAFLSLFLVSGLAVLLLNTLSDESVLIPLYSFPIAESDIFRRQWHVFTRKAASFLFAFLLMFAAVGFFNFGLFNSTASGWLLLVVLAVGQWWVGIITTAWTVARLPTFSYGAVLGVGVVAFFTLMVARDFFLPSLMGLIAWLTKTPYWLIPTGWLTLALEGWPSMNYPLIIGAFLLVAAYTYSLQFALLRLRNAFRVAEPSPENSADWRQEGEMEEMFLDDRDAAPFDDMGPTAIEDHVRDGGWMKPRMIELSSSLDRWFWRNLNPRQRLIAEFSFSDFGFTAQWRKTAILMGVLIFAAFLSQRFSIKLPILVYLVGAWIVGALALPLNNPLGRIFTPSFFSGMNMSWYTGFPLGFRELSGLILKVNALRLIVCAPFVIILGIALGHLYDHGWSRGLVASLKVLWILFAVQPAMVVFFFSSLTNDTSGSGGLSRLTIACFLVALLCFGVAVLGMFLSKNFGLITLSGLFVGMIPFAFHRVYGWLFSRGKFDLMQVPKD